jgi:hypothetical protein
LATKNDLAWNKIFDNLDVLNKIEKKSYIEISASQIKEISGREPRLITKIDYSSQLPDIFAKNRIGILPNSRGTYVLSKMNVFNKFPNVIGEIYSFKVPSYIDSIEPTQISSEANAINCSYISGIISDFVQDEDLVPTISGRMKSGIFNFNIQNTHLNSLLKINVHNAQIEIDGGFEGRNSLTLIEAKNTISNDFIIRQLYYPYRLWEQKTKKELNLVYLTYSNGIYTLNQYMFDDKLNYNNIKLIRSKKYSIDNKTITRNDFEEMYKGVIIFPEPLVPFPQADSFERVVNLIEILSNDEKSKEQITEEFDFDPRQTDYYYNAALYLGLVKNLEAMDGNNIELSQLGKSLMNLDIPARQLKLVSLILSHAVFYEVFLMAKFKGKTPGKKDVIEIMKNHSLRNVNSESTLIRRSSTVMSWVNWALIVYNRTNKIT